MRELNEPIHRRTIPSVNALDSDDDDAALVRASQGGDVDAFAELVRRYEARVRIVLHRLLEDERDVSEAAQDTFVQAWRSLDRFRGDAQLFTWLYRIAVNEALARLRKRRLPIVDLDLAERDSALAAPAAEGPEERAQAADLREVVAAALRELPSDGRVALVLRDVIGLANDEVATVLGLSVPAAKSRIHRARLQLRDELERRL